MGVIVDKQQDGFINALQIGQPTEISQVNAVKELLHSNLQAIVQGRLDQLQFSSDGKIEPGRAKFSKNDLAAAAEAFNLPNQKGMATAMMKINVFVHYVEAFMKEHHMPRDEALVFHREIQQTIAKLKADLGKTSAIEELESASYFVLNNVEESSISKVADIRSAKEVLEFERARVEQKQKIDQKQYNKYRDILAGIGVTGIGMMVAGGFILGTGVGLAVGLPILILGLVFAVFVPMFSALDKKCTDLENNLNIADQEMKRIDQRLKETKLIERAIKESEVEVEIGIEREPMKQRVASKIRELSSKYAKDDDREREKIYKRIKGLERLLLSMYKKPVYRIQTEYEDILMEYAR